MTTSNPRRVCATFLVAFLLAPRLLVGQDLEEPAAAPQPASTETEAAAVPAPLSKRVLRAIGNEAKRYATDGAALVTAPLSWKSKDWEKAAGFVVVLGGLLAADKSIDREMQKNRSHFSDRVGAATTSLGGGNGVKISALLLGAGLVFRDDNTRDIGREALEAGALTGILTNLVLKPAFGRKRPNQSNGETDFRPFSRYDSFPSGHATEAFSVASVVAARSEGWVIPTLAYTAATVVALDRMNSRVHFSSDVWAGAALGIATGKFLVRRHDRERTGGRSSVELEIVPISHGLSARLLF